MFFCFLDICTVHFRKNHLVYQILLIHSLKYIHYGFSKTTERITIKLVIHSLFLWRTCSLRNDKNHFVGFVILTPETLFYQVLLYSYLFSILFKKNTLYYQNTYDQPPGIGYIQLVVRPCTYSAAVCYIYVLHLQPLIIQPH